MPTQNKLNQVASIFASRNPPKVVSALRKQIPTATERTHAAQIVQEWRNLLKMRGDLTVPMKRRAVVESFLGATLEELEPGLSLWGQQIALEHRQFEIFRLDMMIEGKVREVEKKAKLLLMEWHRRLIPALHSELANAIELVREVYEGYEVDPEQCLPAQIMRAQIPRAEDAAAGNFELIGHDLNHWFSEFVG